MSVCSYFDSWNYDHNVLVCPYTSCPVHISQCFHHLTINKSITLVLLIFTINMIKYNMLKGSISNVLFIAFWYSVLYHEANMSWGFFTVSDSLRITQIFYWTFFHLELHLYHTHDTQSINLIIKWLIFH